MRTGAICQIGLMKGIRIADISTERVVRAFELCGHHREDEQGLIAEYYDRYTGLGFEVIAVGKAPSSMGLFDRYATPDSSRRTRDASASTRASLSHSATPRRR
jgi:hypothetical protein